MDIQKLDNEYDLQKTLLLDKKLRIMVKDDASLIPVHNKLLDLIESYELEKWSDNEEIPDDQVEEADIAEQIIEIERRFIMNRKRFIRERLKSYDMTQQDLGAILGHNKSYTSELINGVSQFTLKDLIIIHRVLRIDLAKLIPTYLQNDTRIKVKDSIKRLNNPKLKLGKDDLIAI